MGALHEGHLSLVRLGRAQAATVVVSIFVNPLQFAPGEDFEKYPRTLEKDVELLDSEGVDILFLPSAPEFYPPGFSTSISVGSISEGQEGAVRPGHFNGVATVVAKLFNAVCPDIAVFGRKDLQQAAVVARMIEDLNFPIRLVVAPIARETDGLARSSRNAYLTAEERRLAGNFPRALFEAARSLRKQDDVPYVEAELRGALANFGFEVDYAELVDPESMTRLTRGQPGAALAAAVRLGKIRLLDNVLIEEGK